MLPEPLANFQELPNIDSFFHTAGSCRRYQYSWDASKSLLLFKTFSVGLTVVVPRTRFTSLLGFMIVIRRWSLSLANLRLCSGCVRYPPTLYLPISPIITLSVPSLNPKHRGRYACRCPYIEVTFYHAKAYSHEADRTGTFIPSKVDQRNWGVCWSQLIQFEFRFLMDLCNDCHLPGLSSRSQEYRHLKGKYIEA